MESSTSTDPQSLPSHAREAGRCTVVVGCQWGDEGKGKIVDVLAEDVDIVARYQGGANAGHTVHVGDDEFVLHQIPSGVLHPDKRCLLGNGVVLDVLQFFEEYDGLSARGIDLDGRVGRKAHALNVLHELHREPARHRNHRSVDTSIHRRAKHCRLRRAETVPENEPSWRFP